MKLLLSADLHIGRASTRMPEAVEPDQLRAARAWQDLVDLAVRERVDAVCLAGDVADQANRFWEAIGPLERGVEQLAEAGIRVFAVAGNHDHDVLTSLADNLGGRLRLLGRGGTWERATLTEAGQPVLHIDGWSFAEEHARISPLDSYDLPDPGGVPVLGLVHGDLDAPGSDYGPLEMARLQSLPPAGWLLGHIHAPRLITSESAAWVLYPGSPQALDPGESGAHGVWLVDLAAGKLQTPRLRPLSSVRYESLTVELDEQVETEDDLQSRVLTAIRERAEAAAEESGTPLHCLSLRLEITGRSPLADQIPELVKPLAEDFESRAGQGALVVLDPPVRCAVQPALDLAELARDRSALGTTARLLLELDKPEPAEDVARLVQDTRQKLHGVRHGRHYVGLPDDPPIDADLARRYLREQAQALLAELHGQVTS
ncbi:MAG: exonuclease SbcCD subunit D [Phycisphaeraceae bacterium]